MNRRTVLKNLMVFVTSSAGVGAGVLTHRVEHFYVAGARFYLPKEKLRAGDVVALVPAIVRGQYALSVEDVDGTQIGWVPRPLVAKIDASGVRRAKVVEVSLRRAPWRWYRLMVS
jgi:hypothetical protein